MLLTLMITKLIKTIEFAVTGLDGTDMLPGRILLRMAAEVGGTGEGSGKTCVVAPNAAVINTSVDGSCGNTRNGSRRIGDGCNIR